MSMCASCLGEYMIKVDSLYMYTCLYLQSQLWEEEIKKLSKIQGIRVIFVSKDAEEYFVDNME